MPRLLLHIGTHKTGTTSIQRFCVANRDTLRANGVWYPPADVGGFPSHYAHHRIAHAIAGRDDVHDRDDAAEFFDRVRSKARDDETVLISAEPLYRHMLPDPTGRGGQQALSADESDTRFRNYAAAVRDCLGDFDVTVLVMVRRQDLFLESLYAEQVMSTGFTRTIERFATQRRALLDYDARLDGWADAFGEDAISLRVFESSKLAAPIEQVFVEWLGVEWTDQFQFGERHNVTPSRTFVEFKRMMNIHGQSVPINNRYRRWVEQLSTALDRDAVPDLGRYYLQPEDRMDLLAQFSDGNRAVARRFLDTDTLFDDDPAADLAKYRDRPKLGERDFRAMAKQLFRMIAEELESS